MLNITEDGTGNWSNETPVSSVHLPSDVPFDATLRMMVLIAEVVAGSVGGACVLGWLWSNRRRRSRINVIFLNITLTDLLVIGFACVMQLVWEMLDRNWMAGDAMCRLLKWGQSFSIMSSNNMLVVLSLDRHQAVRSPLKEPCSIMKLAGVAYGVAALLSTPQLAVFRENFVTTDGIFQNKTVCESIFRVRPPVHRQVYLTFVSIVVFYLPLAIIVFCYVRIYLKISEKTAESQQASAASTNGGATHSSKKAKRPGKVFLQSTKSSSLPKARIKTLKMTVVIVCTFVVFGIPYHVLETALSFGYHTLISPTSMAIAGAMAVGNSAVNPFVFLVFNGTDGCLRWLKARGSDKRDVVEMRSSCTRSENRSIGGGTIKVSGAYAAATRGAPKRMQDKPEPTTIVTLCDQEDRSYLSE